MLTKLTGLAVLLCLLSCMHHRSSYAIRDFPDTLQTWLVRAINTGIVGYDTATGFIRDHATDSEITLLSKAEIPILRAIALNEMAHRPGFNHNLAIRNHLDDTAIIFKDFGEWGVRDVSVIDYVIHNGEWKTEAARDSLANEVVLQHDNLESAYDALSFLPSRPEYHDHIIKMALRDRNYQRQIERALFALATYRRKTDIPLIKEVLLEHRGSFTMSSFGLMEKYADTAYLEILESYYPRLYYRSFRETSYIDVAGSYIDALASYKADTCAKILTAILNRKPFVTYPVDTIALKDRLFNAIWNNPCRAFSALRARIAPEIRSRQILDSMNRLPTDTSWVPPVIIDTSAQPVHWW